MKKNKEKLPELKIIKAKNEVITEEDMRNISDLKKKGYTFRDLDRAYGRVEGTMSRYYGRYKKGKPLPKQSEQPQTEEFDYGKLGALIRANWGLKDLMVEFSAEEAEIKMRIKELIKREKSKNRNRNMQIHSSCRTVNRS